MRILNIAAILVIVIATGARAETFPVITDQTVLSECGDCHMAFPPETLPKALWQKIIRNLSDHFGEDASIDDATVAVILDYHVKNASDVSQTRAAKVKWRTTRPVTRILDAPRFIDKHRGCDAAFKNPQVKSPSNCLACHPDMQRTGSTNENLSFLPASVRRQCGD
ncbi:MAG: diheme cytochrome c [Rhodospirillaceae bacterium]|nr:diheme cytochrome c [Rhodospirillaceae bacterium]